jgi:hypothetical protein
MAKRTKATKRATRGKRAPKFRKFEPPFPIPGMPVGEIGPGPSRAWLEGFAARLKLVTFLADYAEVERERHSLRTLLWALHDGFEAAIYCVARDEAAEIAPSTQALDHAGTAAELVRLCSLIDMERECIPEAVAEIHALLGGLLVLAADDAKRARAA